MIGLEFLEKNGLRAVFLLAQHFQVGDAVFVVGLADRLEAKAAIEFFQVRLGADADIVARV